MKRLISKYVERQILYENIKKEEVGVYQYGYTLLFEKLINFIILVIITILSNGWFPVAIFMLAFVPLRQYSGGWHAKTFARCTVISNMVLLVNTFIYGSKIDIPILSLIIVEVIAVCVIIGLSPVQSSKNLNTKECLRYKKIVSILIIVSIMFEFALLCQEYVKIVSIFVYAHSIVAIALLLGKNNSAMLD